MLRFWPPHTWAIGSTKCSVFAFIENCSLSIFFYSILPFIQISSATLFMTWCHTDQCLFDFRVFVWHLAVLESMQSADIRPHPTSYHHEDEYLQVTYLLTSRRRLMMSRFDTYSKADTMTLYQTLETAVKLWRWWPLRRGDDGRGERQWSSVRVSFNGCIDNGSDWVKGKMEITIGPYENI